MLDLLIKDGQYPDFGEGQMKLGNVGITDGKITYIGPEAPEAKEIINASGRVVSPGFIDIHMAQKYSIWKCEI